MIFEELITSKSRYAVLKILALRKTAVHLRAIAKSSGLSPRGAQLACNFLEKNKIVTVSFEANRKLFKLNERAVLTPIIREHFLASRRRQLAKRALSYTKAAAVLDQVNQIVSLTSNASR